MDDGGGEGERRVGEGRVGFLEFWDWKGRGWVLGLGWVCGGGRGEGRGAAS